MPHAIRQGFSQANSAAKAVAELATQLDQPDIGLVVFFCSSHYDRRELAAAMNKDFPSKVVVIGCTTAGEITPQGYKSGAITGVSLGRAIVQADAILIRNLSSFGLTNMLDAVRSLNQRMEVLAGPNHSLETFAALFIDGMSGAEDGILSALQTVIPDIPLFGGSAGDDLAFRESFVFAEGDFHSNAAVFAMVNSSLPFKVFKTQHYVASDKKMVITGADPVRRVVTEINAEPAAQEFARIIGLDVTELSPLMFATHPVVVRVGGQDYVRSIQKVNPDGSLSFFCAIDEGLVLSAATNIDAYDTLNVLFDDIEKQIGPTQLVLGCECVLRLLEREQIQDKGPMGTLLSSKNVVGFNTYGEQYQGIHVNQTFTGVAFGMSKP